MAAVLALAMAISQPLVHTANAFAASPVATSKAPEIPDVGSRILRVGLEWLVASLSVLVVGVLALAAFMGGDSDLYEEPVGAVVVVAFFLALPIVIASSIYGMGELLEGVGDYWATLGATAGSVLLGTIIVFATEESELVLYLVALTIVAGIVTYELTSDAAIESAQANELAGAPLAMPARGLQGRLAVLPGGGFWLGLAGSF
jgi:hypothetical protein